MTKNHNYFLDLAFQLAEKNLGQTKLNPSVGTVIVKNNSVISSGVTSLNGRPHSEFNALKNLKNSSGASLYTTLEPCAHYGKTPPCVNIIIKKKIKNVYYAFEDPDTRTFKKAKKILNQNGIKSNLINDNKISLEKKLTKISIVKLNEVLGNVKSNNISLNHQDESKASYCKKIKKIDGLINFNQSSQLIFNTFRAYKEWPQSTFEYKKILIKIHDMYISDKQSGGVPGTISLLDKTGIYINTCDKMIVITNLQFPNKKIISAVDVFNSYKEFFS